MQTGIADNTLTTVLTVITQAGDYGFVQIQYGIHFAVSGEVCQETGLVLIPIANDSTSGRGAGTPNETSVQYLTAGEILTTVWTVDTTNDNMLIQLTANATMTGAPGTATLRWKATCSGDISLTPP
jgi:hypothetical protein